MKKLGDAELEIMLVIWNAGEAVTSTYIQEHLRQRRNWALSTVMTTLHRLGEKGFVHCDRSTRTNLYSPLISEEDYKAMEGSSMLERLFGNSVGRLVANLYSSKSITQADLEDLKQLIDALEKGEEPK